MKYDLSNPLQKQQLRTRFEMLFKKEQGVVELTLCKPQTTVPQNRYTRVICAYFGCMTGYDADYVYSVFFKSTVNYNLFAIEFYDELLQRQSVKWRSMTALSVDEASKAIDRFIQWAANTAGVYIPSPSDYRAMCEMERTIQLNEKFI